MWEVWWLPRQQLCGSSWAVLPPCLLQLLGLPGAHHRKVLHHGGWGLEVRQLLATWSTPVRYVIMMMMLIIRMIIWVMMIIVMMTIMMMMTQVYVGSPSWNGCWQWVMPATTQHASHAPSVGPGWRAASSWRTVMWSSAGTATSGG